MWQSVVLILLLIFSDGSDETMLSTITSCICSGQEAVFRCTIDGGIATVWRGSALGNCSGGSIILRHSQFHDGHTIKNETCGTSGQVIGQTISAENGTYISNLTINITQQIIGSHIICTNKIVASEGEINGSDIQITLLPAYLYSSSQIVVAAVNSGYMTFQWSPVPTSCPSLYFIISATGVGNCTNATTSDSVIICSMSVILQPTFILNIQSSVCGNILGAVGTLVVPLIEVPSTPTVKVMEIFNSQIVMLTTFHETKQFNISEGIDGTAFSYTIIYTDIESGGTCDSIEVPAFRCQRRHICSHLFDVSSSTCVNSTNISVSVYATNLLGDGPASEPVSVELYYRGDDHESSSCECFRSDLNTSLFTGIGAVVIILLIMIVSTTMVVMLIRGKAKLQKKLERLMGNTKIIYEEVKPVGDHLPPSPTVNTRENSAYGVCI